ncbi:hypothetical protein DFJ77DRAFT_543161 [Powellomyces hirtus]|nr:hypothetical protein DFJ77DRAFT_543161 [Powellomyces hirtus]
MDGPLFLLLTVFVAGVCGRPVGDGKGDEVPPTPTVPNAVPASFLLAAGGVALLFFGLGFFSGWVSAGRCQDVPGPTTIYIPKPVAPPAPSGSRSPVRTGNLQPQHIMRVPGALRSEPANTAPTARTPLLGPNNDSSKSNNSGSNNNSNNNGGGGPSSLPITYGSAGATRGYRFHRFDDSPPPQISIPHRLADACPVSPPRRPKRPSPPPIIPPCLQDPPSSGDAGPSRQREKYTRLDPWGEPMPPRTLRKDKEKRRGF